MKELELFKTLCDLWTAHFSIMLTCITILAGLFGIGCPLLISFFQRKDISDIKDKFEKELTDHVEQIKNLKNEIIDLKESLQNAYTVLAQFYLDKASDFLKDYSGANTSEQKVNALSGEINSIGNFLKCLINSEDKTGIIVMLSTVTPLSEVFDADVETLDKALNQLYKQFPNTVFFVTESELANAIDSNEVVYKKFVAKYKPIFDFIFSHYHVR